MRLEWPVQWLICFLRLAVVDFHRKLQKSSVTLRGRNLCRCGSASMLSIQTSLEIEGHSNAVDYTRPGRWATFCTFRYLLGPKSIHQSWSKAAPTVSTGFAATIEMSDQAIALGPPPDGDCISIENLQLAKPIKAPNIWNEVKEQPAWLTVHVYLGNYFSSAASADALDESTIHYGNLAKFLRSECAEEYAESSTLEVASSSIERMAKKPKIDRCIADRMVVKLLLPKASAYGSALELHETTPCTRDGRDHSSITRTFVCRGLKIMTLIGVNSYERQARQPLVVDFTMNYHHGGYSTLSDMEALFPLERALVQVGGLRYADAERI